ncbi:MAG: class I SAM-dependent methyltransferase [Myxococcota bacterium]|nr:class I SAM-dependent methyltransferase [Myxococcota bacterium]
MTDSSAQIFDSLSRDYDDVFSSSKIGRAQRRRVWEHLEKCLRDYNIRRVLELNCGTGVDARWFASRGCEVVATDISPQMLEVAKANDTKESSVSYQKLDLRELHELDADNAFDLVFSNFGGLNCINESELRSALSACARLLTPNGVLMTVVMPRICLWESTYYTYKRNLGKAVRRWSRDGSSFSIDGQTTNIYYYSPKELVKLAASDFDSTYVKPVGALIPPSYCENTLLGRERVVHSLGWLESLLPHSTLTAAVADHFLMEFRRRI